MTASDDVAANIKKGIEYAGGLHPYWLGEGRYDKGGDWPSASMVRNDTGEDLPFSESHRLTDVVKVRLEAGEYIVPAHLAPRLVRVEEQDED